MRSSQNRSVFKKIHNLHIYILLGLVTLFIGFFTFDAFARHDNFHSRRLDLGNMDQTVWNVLHGNGFTLTDPMGTHQESRLAVHADFLLILLAPFYVIWSSPKMLILIQTIILGLGAIPVFWIARDKLKSRNVALLFSAVYLLYPTIQRTMLHDFHAVVLSTTFLLFAYWYMEKENYLLFIIFALLAAFGKEQVWITTGFMGLYVLFLKKRFWVGALVTSVSFITFYLLFWKFIPAVTITHQHFALAYLSEFGGNLDSILKNILKNPFLVIKDFFARDNLFYLFQLFFSSGFLSVFSPITLIYALPSIGINALSNNPLMRQIDYQYASVITPFIFISAIDGFRVVTNRITKTVKLQRRQAMMIPVIVLAVSTAIGCVYWGELPFGKNSRFFFFLTPDPAKQTMKNTEQSIGSQYSVSATNDIGAHFSQRELLYNFPINAEEADFDVIHLGDPYAWPSGDEQKAMKDRLMQNPNYELIAHDGDFYAFKRKDL